jgi:hypothetical protein
MDLSSFVFISALSLINADGNITSITLQNTTGVYESNPVAAPLATGDTHYINNAAAIGACIFAHDELKDLDRRIGLENQFGTKDVFTIGITVFEYFTISTWVPYQKADIGWELGLSEAEFLITSTVFNIKF